MEPHDDAVGVTLDAMNQSFDNANEDWRTAALDCVHTVALQQHELTSDDVHVLLDKAGVHTHNWSAIGPVMTKARKEGWIERTGRIRRSSRIVSHGKLLLVWQSLLVNRNGSQ